VALVIALLSFYSLRTVSGDFQAVVVFSRYVENIMLFTNRMSEMQRQALLYISTGQNSAADRVGEIYVEMIQGVKGFSGAKQLETEKYFQITSKNLYTYYTTFQEMRNQREIQQRLVREEFRRHATKAQQLIEEKIVGLQGGDTERILQYYRMLQALLQIEKNAYRYFDSLDSKFVEAALESIRETGEVLDALKGRPQSDLIQLGEISAVLARYRSSFLEAVQRTRGYLYLIDVVMAAQVYETIYQSKQFSLAISRESEHVQAQMLENITLLSRLLVIAAIILLLFIGIFSFLISRSITDPLNRLTETFRRLASGSSETEIPKYTLKDELGELTSAAESFKERNRDLEESRTELGRSNEELEQFVYTVSHDLKSPLVTSMGFISIIRKFAEQGKYEQAVARLDRVARANERMSQLIRDLLELSRVGRIDSDKKMIDLNELLRTFIDSQSIRLRGSGLSVAITSELPEIYGNESRVLQVFENILSNALKYVHNEEGGKLEIYARDEEEWRYIFCQDNGPGIPPEYHEKIFGLFYRLDANEEGTGVGLAVVKKIMKFHGGDIQVEPETGRAGEGAVFRLSFPGQQPDAAQNTV
ncbi:MAG: sensor histidine kinase, partial [Candidatus Electrothrix sp. AUS1_2]|nr:sensor histidine kinase [Candidatus Electrothrix sp. AUS1_2]